MGRPTITVHNAVSLDGQLTGFPVDIGLFYEVAAALPHDAVLTGSTTVLTGAGAEGVDLSGDDVDDPGPGGGPGRVGEDRPWLVVPDSRGRLRRLSWLRAQPYWRDVIILASEATPAGHVQWLRARGVEYVVAGADQVDLVAALGVLADRYGIGTVRVDAGGRLNGCLLAAGLVDEISVLVAPHLAGAGGSGSVHFVNGLAGKPPALALSGVQRLRDDYVWLRYAVRQDTEPAGQG